MRLPYDFLTERQMVHDMTTRQAQARESESRIDRGPWPSNSEALTLPFLFIALCSATTFKAII